MFYSFSPSLKQKQPNHAATPRCPGGHSLKYTKDFTPATLKTFLTTIGGFLLEWKAFGSEDRFHQRLFVPIGGVKGMKDKEASW